MKNNNLRYTHTFTPSVSFLFLVTLVSFVIIFTIASCSKDITQTDDSWGELVPTKLDDAAGNWKTVILASADSVKIPVPDAITTPQYIAELAEIKTLTTNLTADQKAAIKYWSAGSALRWNEIMRALVAKHNLAPANNADGVYPIPDQTNPFAYPEFPFSNPPYAARAYAYVTVGQYDALIAAYKLKKQYNRPAPYKTDASITPSVSKSDLASYPNEDAVLAGVSVELLKFLFPTEIDFLNEKANEARQYKMWAGAATRSDITAGDSLGRAVALKVLARAKTDGMKNAIGTQAKWDSLAQNRIAIGETPWKSMESPTRPPMLPFYGGVKTWLITNMATIRPTAPPSTNSSELKQQLAEVLSFSKNPTRENTTIVHFWADGTGTHTPPGHWNAIACDLLKKENQSEVRTTRNLALLNMAMMDAAIECWDTKSYYYYPRPSQLDPSIKTLTGLPNFPSYTSGHSTFSGAAATILGYIFPSQKTDLESKAKDASLSRLYGAIHYRMDCDAGLKAGNAIGTLAIERAKIDGAEQ